MKIITKIIPTLCAIALIIGCVGVTIKDDQAKSILVKTAARVLAYKVLLNNPSYIDGVVIYCKAFKDQEISQAMLDGAVDFLANQIADDPLLAPSLKDLTDLIVVKVDSPDYDPELIRIAAIGFLEGAELARLHPKV